MNRLNGKTILLIEENKEIRSLVAVHLKDAGYEILEAAGGCEGKKMIVELDPCFIIMELILPDSDGEELCKWLREDLKSDVPLIILTSKSSEKDRINGLLIGADDYVTKPFSPNELTARVATVLRRTSNRCNKISYRGLTIKPMKKIAKYQGIELDLTVFEFNLLLTLMKHPGQILSREQLLGFIYQHNEKSVTERTIDVHIRNLREKLFCVSAKEFIKTIRGAGYKFDPF